MRAKPHPPTQTAGLAIHASLSRPHIIAAVLDAAAERFHGAECALALADPAHRDFELIAAGGKTGRRGVRSRLADLHGWEGRVHRTGEPLWWPGPGQPTRDLEALRSQSLFPAASLLAAPVRGEKPLGVLVVYRRTPNQDFNSADAEALGALALHAAVALENAVRHAAERGFALELRRQVRAATAQLRAANESLRQADAIKSDLLSTVAHELRTPITSISGFAKLLLQQQAGPLTEAQSQYCRIIANNSDALGRLIMDLLDLTKLEQGRLEMHWEELALAALIKEAVLPWQTGGPERPARLEADLPDPSVRVRGDRMRLIQVVNNLVTNAYKYSEPGTPIRVGVVSDGSAATVSVTNLGPALTAEQQVRVFEKFYRIRSDNGRAVPGTGLGLAIARSIVTAHGGSIWAENAPEGGTRFAFSLPLGGPEPSEAGAR